MDHNLAFACIGYGALRVLRSRDFQSKPYALPANRIMQQRDPVEYCIEAMREVQPDWAAKVDPETRLAIHARLTREALRGLAN